MTRRQCPGCGAGFRPRRKDQRYCSGACRQHACRVRSRETDWQREIDAARLHYWRLVARAAVARGVPESRIVTEQAMYVDENGDVWRGFPGAAGAWVGRTEPRAGWSTWGLQAAGPPFDPPPNDREAGRQREGRELPHGRRREPNRRDNQPGPPADEPAPAKKGRRKGGGDAGR